MFFTRTGLIYHGYTDYTEFELASDHLQGKMGKKHSVPMFFFEGGLKHAGR